MKSITKSARSLAASLLVAAAAAALPAAVPSLALAEGEVDSAAPLTGLSHDDEGYEGSVLEGNEGPGALDSHESLDARGSSHVLAARPGPIVDPWKACANYADLQNALKGDATFIATGYNLGCTWNNSDVQPSITIKNTTPHYLAPGTQIFYCTKGGAVGKKVLWGNSLSAGQTMQEFVPFGSGNSCLAKAVTFQLRNPPR